MRLISTNIIMRHASSFENERVALPALLGDRHTVTMETADPTLTRALQSREGKSHQLYGEHPNFHSVSVMCLKWNCLSGRAPLEPIIGLRPGLG